jgi:hypothetical protein
MKAIEHSTNWIEVKLNTEERTIVKEDNMQVVSHLGFSPYKTKQSHLYTTTERDAGKLNKDSLCSFDSKRERSLIKEGLANSMVRRP